MKNKTSEAFVIKDIQYESYITIEKDGTEFTFEMSITKANRFSNYLDAVNFIKKMKFEEPTERYLEINKTFIKE